MWPVWNRDRDNSRHNGDRGDWDDYGNHGSVGYNMGLAMDRVCLTIWLMAEMAISQFRCILLCSFSLSYIINSITF